MATAAHIIDRAKLQLADPNLTRWSEAELIKYINDGHGTFLKFVLQDYQDF